MTRILVVDNSKIDQTRAGTLLEQMEGLTLSYADNGQQAVDAIEKDRPDIVLTDLRMPVMDGLELIERIRGD